MGEPTFDISFHVVEHNGTDVVVETKADVLPSDISHVKVYANSQTCKTVYSIAFQRKKKESKPFTARIEFVKRDKTRLHYHCKSRILETKEKEYHNMHIVLCDPEIGSGVVVVFTEEN